MATVPESLRSTKRIGPLSLTTEPNRGPDTCTGVTEIDTCVLGILIFNEKKLKLLFFN